MKGSPNQVWMSARTRYGRMKGTICRPGGLASISACVPVLGRLVARMPVTRCFLNSASTSSTL